MHLIFAVVIYLIPVSQTKIAGRIIGSYDAKPGEFPHQVSLQRISRFTDSFVHFCGGSILDERWILTAAHCLDEMDFPAQLAQFIVKAGKLNLVKLEDTEQAAAIESFFKHDMYCGSRTDGPHDIGLIKLSSPLQLNKWVALIHLPENYSEPSGDVILSGWGAITNHTKNPIYPKILQTFTVPLVERETCFKSIESLFQAIGEKMPEDLICETNICTGPLTGGFSVCSGDSGSALIGKKKNEGTEIIGFTSFTAFPCGRVGGPSVYVKVSFFIEWIENIKTNN